MAISNNSIVVSGNEQVSKKKAAKKTVSSARSSTTSKASTVRSRVPVEILFTQEPNPYRAPEPPFIWIDFPTQSENFSSSEYVVRLGVGGADLVEISIDKGPWLPCRLNSGFWWYDWSNISKGRHTLAARMRASDGRWFKTPLRQCDCRTE